MNNDHACSENVLASQSGYKPVEACYYPCVQLFYEQSKPFEGLKSIKNINLDWNSNFTQTCGGPQYIEAGINAGCKLILIALYQKKTKPKPLPVVTPTDGINFGSLVLYPTPHLNVRRFLIWFQIADGQIKPINKVYPGEKGVAHKDLVTVKLVNGVPSVTVLLDEYAS